MRRYLQLLIPAILVFLHPYAQIKKPGGHELTRTMVDNMVTSLMDKGEVTGLCLGIINENKPVYIHTYGYKNKPLNQRMDTASSLYAASLAKPLFGYLVMQLVDKKIIDLDKPLYTYLPKPLPEYDNYKDLASDDRWKLITARHCLTHTTGFPNWREYNNPHNNKKLEIFFTPGQFYAYSGEGIELLQMVIEIITGRKLEELAQENIFNPFGMRRTSFLWQPAFETDFALGHDMNEDTIAKYRRTEAHAAGSMETTIADYTRFMAAIMQGKRITQQTSQEMISPQISIKYNNWVFPPVEKDSVDEYQKIQLAYGMGWGLFNTPYGKAFFKEGHLEGWQHYTIGFPDKKMACIIMTNSSNGESIFKELVEKLTGVTIPWKWEGYFPYRETARLSTAQLQKFTGEYDGRLKAIITLENGKLKVESPTVNLPKTTIYAASDHHLFLKIMDAEFEFEKGPDGAFDKIIANDEGEYYELKRVKSDSRSVKSIDTSYSIKIGGVRQWVNVKGSNINNPVLLWLCGGPGSSVMTTGDKFSGNLQAKFLVVQWDQRESGKTLSLNKSPVPLTLSMFQCDTHELIDSLLLQFHQRKIYLAGMSWGTALGFYIADKYPELLHAYIAVSPMTNQLKSEQLALDIMKAKAADAGNQKAVAELSQVFIPFQNGQQLYYDRKWLIAFDGQHLSETTLPKKFIMDWAATWLNVFNEASRVNLNETLPEIKCPVYIFAGRKDYQTYYAVTETYFNQLNAPKKKLYWFKQSGHPISDTEPDLMQQIIMTEILPETIQQ